MCIINVAKLHESLSSLEPINKEDIYTVQELKIDFRIPVFHRSVATKIGDIYLIGGTEVDGKKEVSNKVYIYNKSESKTYLVNGPRMNTERTCHSVCELNN